MCITPEKLHEQFDVILCLEIIEHVADVDLFIKSCAKLLKKRWRHIFCNTKQNR
jgi:2-polyprenyl-6-hydroxyphenyl methylase / 3-demethylubiquinone-9 3-methyltransferase